MSDPGLEPTSLAPSIAAAGWQILDRVASDVGPSFYFADVGRFERNCRRLLAECRAIYPKSNLGYSYKTNYLPAFALRAHALGSYAEVVSRSEFDYALLLGIPAARILFNGPVKTPDDVRCAASMGACVNVDSLDELRLASALPSGSRIGIRCNLREPDVTPSRFGIDVERDDALRLLDDVRQQLSITGLHVHYSGDRRPQRYEARIRALIRLHREVLRGAPLEFLDIGGGFMSPMSPDLAARLGLSAASYADYARAIATPMVEAYGADGPELILEPGMAVLADVMAFVTRVHTVKRMSDRNVAVVDGSIFNVKPLRGSAEPVAHVVSGPDSQRVSGSFDICGHTCMEVDRLRSDFQASLAAGDFFVFENMGAYTNVLNAPFIRGTPAILEWRGDRVGPVLRRASTFLDLAASYGVFDQEGDTPPALITTTGT